MANLTLVSSSSEQCMYVDDEQRLRSLMKISLEDALRHFVHEQIQITGVAFIDVNEDWYSLVGRLPLSLDDVVQAGQLFEIISDEQKKVG